MRPALLMIVLAALLLSLPVLAAAGGIVGPELSRDARRERTAVPQDFAPIPPFVDLIGDEQMPPIGEGAAPLPFPLPEERQIEVRAMTRNDGRAAPGNDGRGASVGPSDPATP